MAKHNFVFLYGQVIGKPKIFTDDNGNYIRGMCAVNILRGVRDFGDNINHLKYDCPVVMSGNPKYIEEMTKWNENDMVEIKGAITTKDINKSTKCRVCGEKNIEPGNVVFINPIYLSLRETGITRDQGLTLLKSRCEISNLTTVIGTLCRDPQSFRTDKGTVITQYQLAINRKYRIKEDIAENRTDFPWVKAYGKRAEMDAKVLKKGSVVFVDGMIQTRDVERKTTCKSCGEEYRWNDSALEIIPYETEYLQNYVLPEELDKIESELNEKARKEVFK